MGEEDRFRRAVEFVLGHEGGYVSHPDDPGGETAYGLSKRQYPDLDMTSLTREQAIEIYRRDWWERYGYGRLPEPLAVKVFDLAVHVGPQAAHRMLQRALRTCGEALDVDGILGPKTLEAAGRVDVEACLRELRAEAALYYCGLIRRRPQLERFARGWMRRAVT
mgnify:CR=1 FL=1